MTKKLKLTSILFCLLILSCYSQLALAVNIPPIPNWLKAKMSVVVMDSQSGKVVYSHSPNTPRLIASNMKLLTTAVALDKLGLDFHWHTKLFYDGKINDNTLQGNLYLLGGGDPTLDDAALANMFSQLTSRGINQINGSLIINNSIFNSLTTYSMLKTENYDIDTVLPNGLIVDGNDARFNVHIHNKLISIDSNLYGYNIINHLVLNNTRNTCKDLNDKVVLQGKTVIFSGNIPELCNNQALEFNMLNNPSYTAMALTRTLDNLGIKLNGAIVYNDSPQLAHLLADHSSSDFLSILDYMNHDSVNLIAETLLLSLGAYTTSNNDTYTQSKEVYTDFMREHNLINPKFKLENGAGLSRTEYMRPIDMARLLWLEAHSKYAQDFIHTLPSPNNGTLTHFNDWGQKVRFKTGTLNDTSAYSGYFYTANTRYIIVAVANNIDTRDTAQTVQFNAWMSSLLSYLDYAGRKKTETK